MMTRMICHTLVLATVLFACVAAFPEVPPAVDEVTPQAVDDEVVADSSAKIPPVPSTARGSVHLSIASPLAAIQDGPVRPSHRACTKKEDCNEDATDPVHREYCHKNIKRVHGEIPPGGRCFKAKIGNGSYCLSSASCWSGVCSKGLMYLVNKVMGWRKCKGSIKWDGATHAETSLITTAQDRPSKASLLQHFQHGPKSAASQVTFNQVASSSSSAPSSLLQQAEHKNNRRTGPGPRLCTKKEHCNEDDTDAAHREYCHYNSNPGFGMCLKVKIDTGDYCLSSASCKSGVCSKGIMYWVNKAMGWRKCA